MAKTFQWCVGLCLITMKRVPFHPSRALMHLIQLTQYGIVENVSILLAARNVTIHHKWTWPKAE